MASRLMHEMYSMSRGLVFIPGSFQPNGTSAVAASTVNGHGFSVARSGVGVFDVTLEDKFVDFISITANISTAAIANNIVRPGTIAIATKTFELLVFQQDGDATVSAVDIANDADSWIHFLAILKNTSVPH